MLSIHLQLLHCRYRNKGPEVSEDGENSEEMAIEPDTLQSDSADLGKKVLIRAAEEASAR